MKAFLAILSISAFVGCSSSVQQQSDRSITPHRDIRESKQERLDLASLLANAKTVTVDQRFDATGRMLYSAARLVPDMLFNLCAQRVPAGEPLEIPANSTR